MMKVVTVLGLAAGVFLYAAGLRQHSLPEYRIATRPISMPQDGFTSSQPCRACHPAQYETWKASFHRTMTQVASPETVRSDFGGTVIEAVHGRPMRLDRRGQELWAEFDDPDWILQGSPVPQRIARRIVMTTGSHNQEVYWYETGKGRELGQLPGTYLIAERRWIPRSMVFLAPPNPFPQSTTGYWNGICINCHTTHGQSRAMPQGTQAAPDSKVAEFGIACESCHGPGDRHAAANQNPLRRYWFHLSKGHDSTIVQPALINPRASSAVCGQCHGVWLLREQEERSVDANGPSFRAGDDISATRLLVRATHADEPLVRKQLAVAPNFLSALFWSDGLVRVSGREYNGLVESPCYQRATESNRTLSCFSCHTMHAEPDDQRSSATWASTHQISIGKEGNEACLQCHPKFRASLTSHTRHAPTSTGSSCYNCHMPYTSYGLLKAIRSHTISSPSVKESLTTGRPNACNLCHLDKSLGWTSDVLTKWYGQAPADLSDDDRTFAASLVWMLRGDAGQRVLVAWAMGWQPAQQASGSDWIPVFLSTLFDDPYDAVRFIAYRSMRSLPGMSTFRGDFLASAPKRRQDIQAIADAWRGRRSGSAGRIDPALLFNTDGSVRLDVVNRLLQAQDRHPMRLNE